jgi:hypothetical protein
VELQAPLADAARAVGARERPCRAAVGGHRPGIDLRAVERQAERRSGPQVGGAPVDRAVLEVGEAASVAASAPAAGIAARRSRMPRDEATLRLSKARTDRWRASSPARAAGMKAQWQADKDSIAELRSVMEERLHERVIGQDEAVSAVSSVVRGSTTRMARSARFLMNSARGRPSSVLPTPAGPRKSSTPKRPWSGSKCPST